MKKLAILPVLALAALTATACGKKDSDDAAGGADTTAVPAATTTDTTGMAPSAMPPAAPMATDSTHAGMTDSTGAGAPGTNQQDTLIKVDSLKKKP